MTSSNNLSDQSNYLKKIIGLALTDDNFRRTLSENPKDAINNKSADLGFGHDKLSNESHEVLKSITPEEFNTLHNIFQKANKVGIGPIEMF